MTSSLGASHSPLDEQFYREYFKTLTQTQQPTTGIISHNEKTIIPAALERLQVLNKRLDQYKHWSSVNSSPPQPRLNHHSEADHSTTFSPVPPSSSPKKWSLPPIKILMDQIEPASLPKTSDSQDQAFQFNPDLLPPRVIEPDHTMEESLSGITSTLIKNPPHREKKKRKAFPLFFQSLPAPQPNLNQFHLDRSSRGLAPMLPSFKSLSGELEKPEYPKKPYYSVNQEFTYPPTIEESAHVPIIDEEDVYPEKRGPEKKKQKKDSTTTQVVANNTSSSIALETYKPSSEVISSIISIKNYLRGGRITSSDFNPTTLKLLRGIKFGSRIERIFISQFPIVQALIQTSQNEQYLSTVNLRTSEATNELFSPMNVRDILSNNKFSVIIYKDQGIVEVRRNEASLEPINLPKPFKRFQTNDDSITTAISLWENILAVGTHKGQVFIIDLEQMECISEAKMQNSAINNICVTPTHVITIDKSKYYTFTYTRDSSVKPTTLTSCAVGTNGTHLYLGNPGGIIRIRDLETNKVIGKTKRLRGSIVGFLPYNDDFFAATNKDLYFCYKDGNAYTTLLIHNKFSSSITTLSRKGNAIMVGTLKGKLYEFQSVTFNYS